MMHLGDNSQTRANSITIAVVMCLLAAIFSLLTKQRVEAVASAPDNVASAAAQPSQPAIDLPPATQPLSLTLSPSTLLLETDPSSPVTSSFQIFNNSDETEHLQISLMKFAADQTGAAPVIREFDSGDDFKNWMHITPSTISVEPDTWKTVQITFEPPREAALSYYYAIVVSRQTKTPALGGETAIVGAPAILALTTVRSPLAKQELQLKSFRATKRVFEFLPVEFELVVENTGNIHLAPIGNIFINNSSKKDIGQLQINKSNGLILPGSTRTYTLKWEEGFPLFKPVIKDGTVVTDAQGKPKMHLEWDLSKANLLRIGKFSAHLLFIYDDGKRDVPTEAVVNFFVMPWRILAVIGFIVLCVSLVVLMPIIWIMKKAKQQRQTNTVSNRP